jgi:hypothetical protein
VWADRPNVRIRSAQAALLVGALVVATAACGDRGLQQASTPDKGSPVETTTTTITPTTTGAPSTTAPPPVSAASVEPVKPPATVAPKLPPMPGAVAAQRTDALEKVLGEIESALGAVDAALSANEDEY